MSTSHPPAPERRRLLAAVVAVAGVVVTSAFGGLLVGPPAAADETVSQTYPVPADGRLAVVGRGYGHGHGMSQYGAQGAALQGLGYRRILRFYYPGTHRSTASGPIRVLLSADTSPDLVVAARSGLTLRDRGDGTAYALPGGPRRWRLRPAPTRGNATAVGYLAAGRWHRYRPGGKAVLAGDGAFRAAGPLRLFTPSGSARYRGTLRSVSPTPGSATRETVDVLPLDAYVRGVVAREMPATWQPAAVQAQAVAARTYAAWSRAQHPHDAWQICDTTSCQVYGGRSAEHPLADAAVRATRHVVLGYDGEPAFTQFGASSGGWTTAGGTPYLPARRDPYDGFAGNPVHRWTTTVDAARLEAAYPAVGRLRALHVTARDGNGAWAGRIVSLVLRGSSGHRTISGETLRELYGLRSTWLTFRAP